MTRDPSGPFPAQAQNFRSLAGIGAGDGRRVREGILFRTGDLAGLDVTCRASLRDLGIRTFIDFRSSAEREARPYVWAPSDGIACWESPARTSGASLRALLERADATEDEAIEGMIALYRAMPNAEASCFAALFKAVATGRMPLLFGCAAGKDRTGVGAALLLWALGTEREEIIDDYLRSNSAVQTLKPLIRQHYGLDTSRGAAAATLEARRPYLEAALEEIDACWGGIEGYAAETLNLEIDIIPRMRALCLL